MITVPRGAHARTAPLPRAAPWWAITGWGVALLGSGAALAVLAVAVLAAPVAAVIVP